MIRKSLPVMAALAIALSTSLDAQSGSWELASYEPPLEFPESAEQGALRLIKVSDDTIIMAQEEPLGSRPDQPRDVWIWIFIRNALHQRGELTFDARATRYRIDCETATSVVTGVKIYLFGHLEYKRNMSRSPKEEHSTSARLSTKVACEAGYMADAPRFPDRKVARAAAMKLFAERSAIAQARGPFRVISTFHDMIMMAEGAGPIVRPDRPVELWLWFFQADPNLDGNAADTIAIRYRIDCAAGLIQELETKLYLGSRFNGFDDEARPPVIAESIADKLRLQAACEQNTETSTLADIRAARLMATNHFRKTGAAETLVDDSSEALRAGGPFRILGADPDNSKVSMIAGIPPVDPPKEPIEYWLWTFVKETDAPDKDDHDAVAILTRIDCIALTRQDMKRETFLKGRLVKAAPLSHPLNRVNEKDHLLQTACNPAYGSKDLLFLADFPSASQVATNAHKRPTAASHDQDYKPAD